MIDDSQLLSACFKAYNDWLAESVVLLPTGSREWP